MAPSTHFVDLDATSAVRNLNAAGRGHWYPDAADARVWRRRHQVLRPTTLIPEIHPKFTFSPGARIFTIGSCFAREIESNLTGYDLPTLRFSTPESEWPHRPNGLLNEYNAGTISQRIERALLGGTAPPETILEQEDGGFVDLLLPTAPSVSKERAFERRREIEEIYAELPQADVVVITLGLIEAWLDVSTGTYLNRMPPAFELRSNPERYRLVVMDVDDAYPLLRDAIGLLTDANKKVLVTVSPVPLIATLTGGDAVVANSLSKAVLRICAHRLGAGFPDVDYFPSFEIVTSGGLANLFDDNVHVRPDVVSKIANLLMEHYVRLAPMPMSRKRTDEGCPAETSSSGPR